MNLDEIIKITDREKAFIELTKLYVESSENDRNNIREKWDYNIEWIFPNPKRLACSKNENYTCKERIIASLIYDSIENLSKEGEREKYVAFAVIYHSCIALGLNPKNQFELVASVSSPKIAKLMRDFIKRKPEDLSMEAFMLKKETNIDNEIEIFPSWMN